MSTLSRLLLSTAVATLLQSVPLAAQNETPAERQLRQAQAQLAQAQAEEARQQLQKAREEKEKELREAIARKEIVQKIIEVRNADIREMQDLFRNWAELRGSPELKILTATGSPEALEKLETAIRNLDEKLKGKTDTGGVELTGYLIGASRSTQGGPLPSAVGGVVKQLEANFPYKGYSLLETVTARSKIGPQQIQVHGQFPEGTFNGSGVATYSLRLRARSASGDPGSRNVSIEQLELNLRIPINTSGGGFNYSDAGVNIGEIGIPEGRMVVVGKAGTVGTVEGVFLVLKASVVD